MTHELKKIIQEYENAKARGIQCVLATVVALEGSSYRRPGVRMLLLENGKMFGALSGGCVEKEVFRQSHSVFSDHKPKVITYDGRYRLGCEGIIHILLEPLKLSEEAVKTFWQTIEDRETFEIASYFDGEGNTNVTSGSLLLLNGNRYAMQENREDPKSSAVFRQKMRPCFRLVIIGAEHDAVQLCSFAAMTGWEVTIVVDPREEKEQSDFPGATGFISSEAENLSISIDDQTAVMIMTHSYSKDLRYLVVLTATSPAYFGLLGPVRRREKLFGELMESHPDLPLDFFEKINGPAGLDIGAESAQEIAISILAEILAVVNRKPMFFLKDVTGQIHA